MDSRLLMCVILSCLSSAVAIVVAVCARLKANEGEVWQTLRIERVQRRAIDSEKVATEAVARVVRAENRISALEERINKEKESCFDTDPPRICKKDDKKVCLIRKCEYEEVWEKYRLAKELRSLREENKELKKNQCCKYKKGE